MENLVGSVTGTIVRVCAVLLCITFHELAHGYTAYLLGDNTANSQGRLTLNPIAHIDPIGALCMLIAGIGWAKPVPVNPGNFRLRNKKLGMALTALAGPMANFIMSFVCLFFYYLLYFFGSGMFVQAALDFLSAIAVMGLGLGVFNLIPIPPLDGSKVLMPLMPNRIIEWTWRNEGYIRFGFLILVFFGGFSSLVGTGVGYLFRGMSQGVIGLMGLVGIV